MYPLCPTFRCFRHQCSGFQTTDNINREIHIFHILVTLFILATASPCVIELFENHSFLYFTGVRILGFL